MVDAQRSIATRYTAMKQSRSSTDLNGVGGPQTDAHNVHLYVEAYTTAVTELPPTIAPLLTNVQKLDVTFCASMRRLHEMRDEYRRSVGDAARRQTVLGAMGKLLVEMQSNSDRKLAHTTEMAAMTKMKCKTLETRANALHAHGKPVVASTSKRFERSSNGRPVRRTYAETPPTSMNGEEIVDLLSRVAGKRARRPKQFGADFVRHSPTLSATAPNGVNGNRSAEQDLATIDTESEKAETPSPAPRPPPRKVYKRRAQHSANKTNTPPTHKTAASPQSAAPPVKRRREKEVTAVQPTTTTRKPSTKTPAAMETPIEMTTNRRSRRTAANAQTTPSTASSSNATDNNEERWCLCDRVSFGEMIGCDNDHCSIEWFHFQCVTLTAKPKGKWFCPNCRGERANLAKGARR